MRNTTTLLALLTLAVALPVFAAEATAVLAVPDADILFLAPQRDGRMIWDLSRVSDREETNLEFPNLIRFKERWYCSFREGDRHGNDPSGRARVIASEDGQTWETATLIEWEGGDIRDPRLSVTADGQLMVNSSIYFIGEQKKDPLEWEVLGKRQSVTWLSENGTTWTGPYACPTGFDTWRWDVAWHEGYGYSAGYSGKDRNGTLYRTKDGRLWEVWVENFFEGSGSEAALAFAADGSGYCLLRGGGDEFYGKFAVSRGPEFRQWVWQDMLIDAARNGATESGAAFGQRTSSIVGGQKLLCLSDGRLVAITAKGGCDLFWVDPERSLFTRCVRMASGMSYPGLAEYDGEFWITNTQRAEGYKRVQSGVYLMRVKIPPPASVDRLLATAAEVLANEEPGFGALYRERLSTVRADIVARQKDREPASGWTDRTRLLKALAERREARELKAAAQTRLAAARAAVAPRKQGSRAGFGQDDHERLLALCEPLRRLLDNEQATLPGVRQALAELDAAIAACDEATQAHVRAEDALAVTSMLQKETVQGFARLYQTQLRGRAARLQTVLNDPAATTETVQRRIESLLDAAQTYRKVDRDVPVQVTEVTKLPASIVCGTADDWARGLLMDVAVANDALEPAHQPILSFGDGVRTSVRVGNPPQIAALSEAFAITAWALPKRAEAYRTVLDKGGRDAAIAIRQARTEANRNAVSVRMYAEAEPAPHEPYQVSYQPPDPAAFDDHWHHYAATYDGEALRLYVDGTLAGELPKEGRADLLEGDLAFGCLANTGNEPWKGYISGVAVWNESLSGPRIAAQMQRDLQGNEAGLVGHWPLNEGEGATARDASGSGNDGQIDGGVWEVLPVRRGVRLSNPVHLDAALGVATCTIVWETNEDGDSARAAIGVFYGISATPGVLPEQWTEVANGAPFAVGAEASALVGKCLWVKQVLTTDDPTARLRLRRLELQLARSSERRL